MIQVNVKTNTARRTVTTEVTSTPSSVFSELGFDLSSSKVNLNGMQLSVGDMNSTFEQLGIADGASVGLNAIVKADGANN